MSSYLPPSIPRYIVSYEYRIFEFDGVHLDELNILGANAWELVHIFDGVNVPNGRRCAYFKRRVVTLPGLPAQPLND